MAIVDGRRIMACLKKQDMRTASLWLAIVRATPKIWHSRNIHLRIYPGPVGPIEDRLPRPERHAGEVEAGHGGDGQEPNFHLREFAEIDVDIFG